MVLVIVAANYSSPLAIASQTWRVHIVFPSSPPIHNAIDLKGSSRLQGSTISEVIGNKRRTQRPMLLATTPGLTKKTARGGDEDHTPAVCKVPLEFGATSSAIIITIPAIKGWFPHLLQSIPRCREIRPSSVITIGP